jgi:hypothetical protein
MAAASARLELRLAPEVKSRLEEAATSAGMPVSEVVRSAVEDHLERLLAGIGPTNGRRRDELVLVRRATRRLAAAPLPRVRGAARTADVLDDLRGER